MAVASNPRRTQAEHRNESAESLLNVAAESITERGIDDASLALVGIAAQHLTEWARIDIHVVRSGCCEWISGALAAPAKRRRAREERRVGTSA